LSGGVDYNLFVYYDVSGNDGVQPPPVSFSVPDAEVTASMTDVTYTDYTFSYSITNPTDGAQVYYTLVNDGDTALSADQVVGGAGICGGSFDQDESGTVTQSCSLFAGSSLQLYMAVSLDGTSTIIDQEAVSVPVPDASIEVDGDVDTDGFAFIASVDDALTGGLVRYYIYGESPAADIVAEYSNAMCTVEIGQDATGGTIAGCGLTEDTSYYSYVLVDLADGNFQLDETIMVIAQTVATTPEPTLTYDCSQSQLQSLNPLCFDLTFTCDICCTEDFVTSADGTLRPCWPDNTSYTKADCCVEAGTQSATATDSGTLINNSGKH